jgi:glycosyltransferase involved in cell wall biosynthesis
MGFDSMPALRILFVQETNWLERNVIQQHHLAERLARRGHQVEVIDYDILWPAKNPRPWWQPRRIFSGVSKVLEGVSLQVTRPFTIQLPLLCHASWTGSSLLELQRRIRNQKPEIVVGLSLSNSVFMAQMLKRAGIPYVSIVQEPYHTMMPQIWARPPARMVERKAMQMADRVVVFTPQMMQYAQEMGVLNGKVRVLKTGISLDLFRTGMDGSSTRRSLGIGPDQWVLFFMGWLYDFSGLREIVQAIASRPDLLEGASLVIVGDGDLHHELVESVAHAGLEDHIILTGKRPYREVPGLLAAADVCLLPSLENSTTREIVPMKVYEYLAAGKPVVAARLPGLLAEFGEDNGILYVDHPLDALRRAIGLRSDTDRVREMGAAGRRFAEQNADWEKTTQAFEELLLDVAKRSNGSWR